ncbi:MAG: ABC transporter permease [Bacteroidetes bacterium]|nr:ABC transporter permease [Bacteroidota bacterium]
MTNVVIERGRTQKNYWRDLWRFRELFYILAWRDVKVRYKQTVIGAAWSVIRPLLTTIIFTMVFSRVAKLGVPGDAPYAIMVFVGMLPWQFFATALSDSSNSLIGNSNLVSKVYFPRMIIPASSIIMGLVDFSISFFLLLVMFLFYQYVPDIKIFLLPFFVIMALAASFGIGLYVTALNVKYRDFRYIIPFIVQIGLYISPVGFSSSVVPERWRLLYSLNPMTGVIDGFRWCVLGQPLYWPGFAISCVIVVFFLWVGIAYFRKTERGFADNI